MKTIRVGLDDCKKRDELGDNVYEWGGYNGVANIVLPGCDIVLSRGGSIDTGGGYIYTGGGSIDTGGGYIYTRGGDIYTGGGSIDTGGGYINTGGGDMVCGILYWRLMCMPHVLKDKLAVAKVRPDVVCREYWAERLGMELVGCYNNIERALSERLPELLQREDWTPTERWILESHLGERDEDT